MKLAIVLCFFGACALAQEAIHADSALSDDDFYRLVSCAAPVQAACQKVLVRWSPADANDVSLELVKVAPGYPAYLRDIAEAAMDTAIAEINAAGSNLHLTRSEIGRKPDISVYLLAVRKGSLITGTGLAPLDDSAIDVAKTQIWWRADHSLIKAAIVLTIDVEPRDLPSIMLEEVTQSLGFLTDIDGDYYQSRSIFSETSNQLTRLGPQDIMALKRHYP